MVSNKPQLTIVVIAGLFGLSVASASGGPISLEWRPASQSVVVGDTINIELYAVSDDSVDDEISVMDVILEWDPSFMSLQGLDNNGPYNWLSSSFPATAIGGLNPDYSDGDATYTARSQFIPPSAIATPGGLLVTTVQFLALAETPGTMLTIPESKGLAETSVIGDIPGFDVHSSLGSAMVTITPEPASFMLLLAGATMVIRRRA